MLMPVVVRRRQLVMNLQRRGKRRHREQHTREEKRDNRDGFFLGEMTKHDRPGRQIHEARVVTKGPLECKPILLQPSILDFIL